MIQRAFDSSFKGFIILASVLILGAVGFAIALSLLFLSLASSRASFIFEQSVKARLAADACAQEGLEKIRESVAFFDSGSLTFPQGRCVYTVSRLSGQGRTLSATGFAGSVVRKVKITIDKITPRVQVVSWQEVADF